jgi:hypothetical protein
MDIGDKKLVYLFYLIIFCTEIVLGNCNTVSIEKKINITISRNKTNSEAHIYLYIDSLKTDSIVIDDLDFMIDSLVKLNDSLWKYMYSYGCDESDCSLWSKQLLITELNKKIHFMYIGNYKYVSLIEGIDAPFWWYSSENYVMEFSSTSATIQVFNYSKRIHDGVTTIDSSSSIVYLQYDSQKNIYYSSIDTLNCFCEVLPRIPKNRKYESSDTHVALNNEIVYILKINKLYHYMYYKDNWFLVNEYPDNRLVIAPFIPINENNKFR